MAIEITVPRLGWSMEEGTFSDWLKSAGEPSAHGEPLFSSRATKSRWTSSRSIRVFSTYPLMRRSRARS